MDAVIHHTKHHEKYADDLASGETQIEILNQQYGLSTDSLNWDQYADFSGYLSGIYDARNLLGNKKDTQENLEKMIDFMALHETDKLSNKEKDLTKESLFRSISD